MKNILLTIEYDGTNFSGWQRQKDQRTVQGELERVLSILCDQEIAIAGTSRTDAGVHAYGQRATFSGDFGIPIERIPLAANHLLAGEASAIAGTSGRGPHSVGDLRILEAVEVGPDFHARFSAKGKTYWYRIRNAKSPDIMARNFCYQIEKPLDLSAMKEAATYLVGEHDFKAFMAAGGTVPDSTVRTISGIHLVEEEQLFNREGNSKGAEGRNLRIEVTGNGFLYNMVRILTGTLVEVGLGKREPKSMATILAGKDRSQAGHTAPPQGLYLKDIYFI